VGGLLGASSLAAVLAALVRPVPAAEHPEQAEAALVERRFADGDLAGGCRLLQGALQTVTERAEQAAAGRFTQVQAKASQCVDLELSRARKLDRAGCEATVRELQLKRLVHVAGRAQSLDGACSELP
jgi:hypothetical protein